MGRPIPDNVYEYDHKDPGIGFFFRWSKYDPELGELKTNLINSKINDSKGK